MGISPVKAYDGLAMMDKLSKQINRATLSGLAIAGELMVTKAKANLKDKKPFPAMASGKLANSFYVKIDKDKNSVTVGNKDPAAMIVEFGRRPSSKMPPPNEFRDWLIAKGLPSDNRTIFLFSRKMSRYGIPALRYMSRAVAEVAPQVDNIVNKEVTKLIKTID